MDVLLFHFLIETFQFAAHAKQKHEQDNNNNNLRLNQVYPKKGVN